MSFLKLLRRILSPPRPKPIAFATVALRQDDPEVIIFVAGILSQIANNKWRP